MLLPPQTVDADIAERVLDGLDGLIITGGRDVDPAGYGQQPHPATDEPVDDNRLRDAWEFALLNGAIRRGMPVLGHLPRRPGGQRRAGRHPAPAPARRARPHPPSAGQRGVRDLVGAHRARHPAGGADRRVVGRAVLSPPGHRPARRRPDRQRAGRRRRHRGGRDTRGELRFGGAVAPRGTAGRPAVVRRGGRGGGGVCESEESATRERKRTDQSRHRGAAAHRRADRRGGRRRRGGARQGCAAGLGAAGTRRTGRRRCAPSLPSSTRTSTSSPRWRWPTRGIRSATPNGRPATSATSCGSIRLPRNACRASRFRWRADWTSPSTSRSAWSA